MGTKFYKAQCVNGLRSGVAVNWKLFTISSLFILLSFSTKAQTNLSFTQLTGDFSAPGKGAQNWGLHPWNDITQPTIPSGNATAKNYYTRFNWLDIESSTVQGSYSWTVFDNFVNQAIDAGAMFSFGVMPLCDGCGAGGAIPQYVVNLMSAEGKPGPVLGGVVYPNYQSVNWSKRYSAVLRACANHIATTSRNGKPYANAFYAFDLRHAGNFGEFADLYTNAQYGAGAQVTDTYLNAMVDTAIAIFPNVQLTIPMGYFTQNGSLYGNTNGAPGQASAYKVLTASNNFGRIGWRRDNIGDDGYNVYFSGNTGNYNPGTGTVQFQPLIMDMWKYAPIGGEPSTSQGGVSRCGTIYCDLHNENLLFHMSYFGNGNAPGGVSNSSGATWTQLQANWRAASAEQGYRLILTGGSMTTALSSGSPFSMIVNWQNIGIAPVYEKWNVVYELRKSDGTVVWTGNSAFSPRLFLPGAATPASDNFTLSAVAAGTYSMYIIIRDPLNYKAPLPLGITGRGADGSYLLRSNIVVGTGGPVNQPPLANAGGDITIQLPAATVSLTGTGTDADGTVAGYAWTKLSGPAAGTITSATTAATTITGLVQGVYVYTLTVTDNQGATATDNVQITVNAAVAANLPPVANAGTDKTIQLPTNTVAVTGTGTDPDGTVASYAWAKLSGPAGGAIATPAAANTSITGLAQGVYAFTLTVTDNSGANAKDTVQVTVNAAIPPNQPPVAIAGADLIMTLPSNSGALNGSASTDADGSITAFLWTKISGPTQFNIGNSTAASTIASNLTAGVYSFQLKVTDNAGAIALDTIKIIVNAAPVNQPPVANAGADISITLPTNIANLNGSTSTDADGTVTAYAWTQVSGPSTATFGAAGSAATNVSGLLQGVYVFSLKVTDNSGATDLDSIKVTVNPAPNVPPVANAGISRSITLPVNSTSLNGSLSTDPDGTIAAYSWSQLTGPSTASITGSNGVIATAGNLIVGVYNFQLTVTDNKGATAIANVKITVAAAGFPPVANAGADQIITLPVNSVTISGSASTAPSGSITGYAWSEKSGPSAVALSNTVQNTINNLQVGVYIFRLTVTDNNSATGTDSVIITVKPAPNQAPVADAGTAITLILPTNSTNLDASKSADPDGTISSYSWTRISGPNTPAITAANTVKANISGLVIGTYTYQVTVTDNNGASSSAQVKIVVSAAANILPIANAGANQSITSPVNTINLNGSASSDPDGTIVSYSWVTVSGPGSITISNSNSAIPTVLGLQTGSYIFELTVTDNRGGVAKDQVTVIVLPSIVLPNQAPVANAGNNQTITLPVNSVSLSGSSSFDPDGTIVSYSWKYNSGPSVAVITGAGTISPTASQLIAGTYVFQLTVTDNNGATSIDLVNITVNPGVSKINLPPVANAGNSNFTITLPQNSVNLDGSNSMDPDGSIVLYSWRNTSGPTSAVLTGANTATPTASNLTAAGTYIFELTVTDNSGATNIDYVNVVVNPAQAVSTSSLDRLTMYPNPAHSVINGRVMSPIMGTVKISVYDMNGRLVYTAEMEKTTDVVSKAMNIDTLAPGMYSVLINIANRTTIVSKFIKN